MSELLALARQVDPALDPTRTSGRPAATWTGCRTAGFARYGLDPAQIAQVRRRMAGWPR